MQTNDALDSGCLSAPASVATDRPVPRGRHRGRRSVREALIVRVVSRALATGAMSGSLRLDLPSGRSHVFGGNLPGPAAHVILQSFKPLWQTLRRGALGLVEAHIDGAIDTPDLGAVLRFCLANRSAYAAIGGGFLRSRLLGRLWHRRRGNSIDGSRRNIAAHYDLGNAFYSLWLDPTMMYSSAIFDGATETLHGAQLVRLQRIIAALEMVPGHRVLEIGCGWGGLAEALARAGGQVDAITISAEQLAYTQTRLASAGLTAQARSRFCDYRHLDGQYDRIVSIEMIEAVGEENWPIYFKTLSDRLEPGGVAVLQAITIDEAHFDAYRRDPDFIQRYIFPGGMLPTVSAMSEQAAKVGLTFEPVERFGLGYARTLAHWRDAFDGAWPQIATLGFDERFRRMWRYYLTYCEVGFEAGDIDVGLYRLRRPVVAP